jgi:hypothetical protein
MSKRFAEAIIDGSEAYWHVAAAGEAGFEIASGRYLAATPCWHKCSGNSFRAWQRVPKTGSVVASAERDCSQRHSKS